VRFRRFVFLGSIATCAVAAACIPDLLTDPLPDAGPTLQIGNYCGDGILTVGQYDAGVFYPSGEQCDPNTGNTGNDGGIVDDAGVIGCSATCRVECDGGVVDPITNHCYFELPSTTSLLDVSNGAQARCHALNAHVVTFADDAERDFVLSQFSRSFGRGDAGTFWMGILLIGNTAYQPVDDLLNEPGWSAACSGCYAPSNVDGSIPKILTEAGAACILDIGRSGWSQFACSTSAKTPIPVICEREPVGDLWSQCNSGVCASIPETAGKKRYSYSPIAVSADQASNACSNDFVGGSLVVFDSREERETLLRSLIEHFPVDPINGEATAPTSVWIGYSIGADAGAFTWDNDAGLDASPWGDNEPNVEAGTPTRAYASLDNQSYDVQLAHDDDNTTPRPYICQY
jgi:hypothetical protein